MSTDTLTDATASRRLDLPDEAEGHADELLPVSAEVTAGKEVAEPGEAAPDGVPDAGEGDADREAELTLLRNLARDLDGTFEELVRRHQHRLFSIAYRFTGDASDAEELAQDAFVRAYRALAGYQPDRIREMNLRPWLATIVLNLCRNRSRVRHAPTVQLEIEAPFAAVDPLASPHEHLDQADETHRWATLLAGLPALYRAPIVLRHVDGLSYAEMAEALNRPQGTLKAQVHRGLAMLRDAFEAHVRAEVTR